MKKSFFDRLFGWLNSKEPSPEQASIAPEPPPSGAGAERQAGVPAPAAAPPATPPKAAPSSTDSAPKIREPLPFTKDDNQRYYGWVARQTDELGLTYSYTASFKQPFKVDFHFQEVKEPIRMRRGMYHEGNDRLSHIQRSERSFGVPTILVSQDVKKLLSHFQLPQHRFHPVVLEPFRIENIITPYFLLQLEYDTLRKQLAYPVPVRGLRQTYTMLDGYRKPVTEMELPVLSDYAALQKLRMDIIADPKISLRTPEIVTEHLSLDTTLDLYTYKDEIVISEPLRDALQRHFPEAFHCYELNLSHIQIDPDVYRQRVNQYAAIELDISPVEYTFSEEVQRLYARSKARLAENFTTPEDAFGDDEFSEVSQRLQLVLPDTFKEIYRRKPDFGDTGWEWEGFRHMLTLDQADWKEAEAIGAIAFAGNGCGDHLGLPLAGNSLFESGTLVYYFSHEDGSCHEVGELADFELWKDKI